MLNVQKYLIENGIEKLKSEFKIKVNDYSDRIVLNYDQIESPRFHPIVDECRAIILKKSDFSILSHIFVRFYNLMEGVQVGNSGEINKIRVSSFGEPKIETVDILNARIESKIDGSLISVYHDGHKWCIASRSMAFAEGQGNFGRSFDEIFRSTEEYKDVMNYLNSLYLYKAYTWGFELTSPENRVVTPFSNYNVVLIGARNNITGDEVNGEHLDFHAKEMKVKRPERYQVKSFQEMLDLVNAKPWMDEGVVLVIEKPTGSFMRIKCKNPKFVAIANMRENGNISPKNILFIIMKGEKEEILKYFPEDEKYFLFVEDYYNSIISKIEQLYEENKNASDQKTFALSILSKTKNSFESGALFKMKSGMKLQDYIKNMGTGSKLDGNADKEKLLAKKICNAINLKEHFVKNFNVRVEED